MITIISVNLIDGKIEVVKREENMIGEICMSDRTVDKIWKVIYGVRDGEIILEKRIEGEHKPSYFVGEEIIFKE